MKDEYDLQQTISKIIFEAIHQHTHSPISDLWKSASITEYAGGRIHIEFISLYNQLFVADWYPEVHHIQM